MALSRHAAQLAGLSQPCPICGQETVGTDGPGPCDMSRQSRKRDTSDDAWTLTEAGRADLEAWRAEHPNEDVGNVYRQWKAQQEAPDGVIFCGWATSYSTVQDA